MPPVFRPTSVAMKDDPDDWRWRWALPGSFVLHLLIAALLVFELPISLPQPQEEQAIDVDLVPPPPEPKEEAQQASSPPAEEPKPEEAEQPAATPPPPPARDIGQPQSPPALRPVFQFGEKDAGPRQSLEGNAAEDGSASPTPPQSTDQDMAEPSTEPPAQAENEPPRTETTDVPDAKPTEAPEPKPADVPEHQADPASQSLTALSSPNNPDASEESAETPVATRDEVQLPQTAERPVPRPAPAAPTQSGPRLQEAERLYSRSATGDQVATTAMGNVPRDVRGGRLCVTELREQLLRGSPPYFPDLLPSYPLQEGTVIEVSNAAFRVRGQWFDLGFRCEVDAGVTRVVSFAFRVGRPLPRSEWVRRGLPSQ